ncbi:uncharacterized protein BJX67DRAFT_317614 [Aspergillus lucknowensis]|uniref:Myb-like domain-containing protein n=1 Tax=Aspergillus lucknowensis TaxID=176173 RepID=A0ABR4L930_9EURO
MSTFLFYNPNSNPSRYSQKERFSKRQSVLLSTEYSALNTEHSPQVNREHPSSIYPAQSNIRNKCDLQLAEPAHSTATLESTRPPNQSSDTVSESDISGVESLHSLFLESHSGAGTGSPEVGEFVSVSSSSRQNTQSPAFDGRAVSPNKDACVTQAGSGPDGQGCDSDQPSEATASGPNLATYCLNLSPSPILRGHDFVVADEHATSHQSELISPLWADDPKDFAESAVLWESDGLCTSLNDNETRMDANEETNNGQCVVRTASEFGRRPGISMLGLTEHGSPVENAHGSIRDPRTCLALAEETRLRDLNNTIPTSGQPLADKEREDSVPNIAEVVSESNRGSISILSGACSEAGTQGFVSTGPTTPQEPIVDPPIVQGNASFAFDKSNSARSSSSRISSYQSCRKTVAEFSHVEIPSRPIAEVNQSSVAITPLDRRDWSCHPSLANGPWRLDGTTLSIDLRDAERVPIFVGYSSFRVYDGKLTQSLTLFQGSADGPPVNRSVGNPSPPPIPARGPLSLEQKRRLVKLKQEGYTWDEIVTKFPGRKKSNLQVIYSRSLKYFRSLGSIHNHPSRHPSSIPRSSSNDRSLAEITGNAHIDSRQTNQGKGKKSRYNLRARGYR